jgi:hypothetical protein
MQCFTPIVQDWHTPPGTYSTTVSLGPADHSCNVTLSSYEDTNIALVDFVAESMLEEHLNAADMHMISLNKEWSGLVVPSKFFGSLATGKPVIYAGPADSAIACLLREHEIGYFITGHFLISK